MTKKKPKPRKPKAKKATSDQRVRLFCEAYSRNPSGAAAARAAGYTGSDKALSERASRMLRLPEVKAKIDAITAAVIADKPGVMSREDRQLFWSQVARGEITTKAITALGDEVDLNAPWVARLKASELLGKAQGDFVERHEHKITGEVTTFHVEVPERLPLPEPEA